MLPSWERKGAEGAPSQGMEGILHISSYYSISMKIQGQGAQLILHLTMH